MSNIKFLEVRVTLRRSRDDSEPRSFATTVERIGDEPMSPGYVRGIIEEWARVVAERELI